MKKLLIMVAVIALLLVAVVGSAWAATSSAPSAEQTVLAAATPTPTETKAWLGVSVATITDQLAERFKLSQKDGVVVTSVVAKSPAETAGVKRGDVITAVNGVAVKTAQDVVDQVSKSKPGDVVALNITRDGKAQTINVTATNAPTPTRPGRGRLPALPKDQQPSAQTWEERFNNNLGSSHTYRDKNGNLVTSYSIPGTVTAISPTSITITPNNPQSRGGPFVIDGATRIMAGLRRMGVDAIEVGDKVTVTVIGDGNHAESIVKAGPLSDVRQFMRPDRLPNFKLQWPQDLLRRLLPKQTTTDSGA